MTSLKHHGTELLGHGGFGYTDIVDTFSSGGWGPASGVCCDNLIVEFPDGYEIYPLPPRRTETE